MLSFHSTLLGIGFVSLHCLQVTGGKVRTSFDLHFSRLNKHLKQNKTNQKKALTDSLPLTYTPAPQKSQWPVFSFGSSLIMEIPETGYSILDVPLHWEEGINHNA